MNAGSPPHSVPPRVALHWPRRMVGQFTMVLLAGAVATHLIGVLVVQQLGVLVHPASMAQVVERHAVAYGALRDLPAAQASRVTATMSSDDVRIGAASRAAVAPHAMQEEELRLADALRKRLALHVDVPVIVQLERTDGGPARDRPLALRNWQALQLRIAIGLPDGRWLNSSQRPTGSYEWWQLLGFSMPVSILPVVALGFLFVRRILRPLRALVDAVSMVGRGERVDALPLTGPVETRELTHAFNEMQVKLRRFVQDRTLMLAAIGHDFRTPITSLRLQAALVADEALRRDMVETLADMRAMVDATLVFARNDAADEQTEAVDLPALVASVVQHFARAGARVKLQGVCAPAAWPPYRARPVALRRALTNLIDNAVRYGQSVALTLAVVSQPEGVCYRIDIEDNGPGIPLNVLPRVFEPFFRGDSARTHDGGVGLGLAIARGCIQAHGGEVALSNRPEGGLQASILLPC